MIFYFDEEDENACFDPSGLDTFGEVPCVFSIVQPLHDGNYRYGRNFFFLAFDLFLIFFRIGFCQKRNILQHGPLNPQASLSAEATRDIVLTKSTLSNSFFFSNSLSVQWIN